MANVSTPDDLTLISLLQGPTIAAMLYGSRARGAPRVGSDIDILQLVPEHVGSYSVGEANITPYTVHHLTLLAESGSLFVRHLRDEGRVLADDHGSLHKAIQAYVEPTDYSGLRRELVILLASLTTSGADQYATGLLRVGVYAARSALYIATGEKGTLTFDIDKASRLAGTPQVAALLRAPELKDLGDLQREGLSLLGADPPTELPTSLAALAIYTHGEYPMAANLLESVIAGAASVDYTTIALPILT